MTINKTHVIHMLICSIYLKYIYSVISMSSMSTVWEDADGCANQYRYALAIYLMNVLSSSYEIIMFREINASGHGNNVLYVINATEKCYLKEQIELIGK